MKYVTVSLAILLGGSSYSFARNTCTDMISSSGMIFRCVENCQQGATDPRLDRTEKEDWVNITNEMNKSTRALAWEYGQTGEAGLAIGPADGWEGGRATFNEECRGLHFFMNSGRESKWIRNNGG